MEEGAKDLPWEAEAYKRSNTWKKFGNG
jgi:hypothetical protein